MNIKLFSILFALLFFNTANAAQWYVNVNTGDDLLNDGSDPINSGPGIGPKQTINNVLFSANIGDTINISEGLYAEKVVINIPLVIRGANWGMSPLTMTRNPETIIVSPDLSVGSPISGNTLFEIQSYGVEIDGIQFLGDNPNKFYSLTKYNKEYEISYGIAGRGDYYSLTLSNLIISNFAISGINMAAGVFVTQSNNINNCLIKTGEQNAEAITLSENYYANISVVTIDSVGSGLSMNNFDSKNSVAFSISYLNITAETNGIFLNNFTGNTDNLIFQYNILTRFDPAINFTGMYLYNMDGSGQADIVSTTIINAKGGIIVQDVYNSFNLLFSDNIITGGETGMYFQQSVLTPAVSVTILNSELKGLDSSAISAVSDGGLFTLALSDTKLSQSAYGITLKGNTNVVPTNTTFDLISKYYIFLDASMIGFVPVSDIDATNCVYNGISGNGLTGRQPFDVEDKIRHYLDKNNLGWVLFKNNNLYVTTRDGNYSLTSAHTKASNGWNIYLDSISSTEFVSITKSINLYTHPAAGIGRIVMQGLNETLYLHGKLTLSNGLQLIQGFVETTNSDTLILFRSNINVYPGNALSYVKGPLYIRYLGLTVGFNINDVIPIGLSNEFRPVYISAVWPSGITTFDIGFKSFSGKAPILTLPTDISHISDIRYWQLTNPLNSTSFTLTNVGMSYDTLLINDLVNDPANLRVVFSNGTTSFNLGGSGTTPGKGYGLSATGAPGFGFYAFGNQTGGNNILSGLYPVALITTSGHCANDSLIISAENSRSVYPLLFWEWSINGKSIVLTPENSDTIKKLIRVSGPYTIKLIITNSGGFTDTITKLITIDSLPVLSYSAKLPCFPAPIDVTNTSVLPPLTTISQTEWKINTSIFTTPNLVFTPGVSGVQTGRLKITLSNGCSDTLPVSVMSYVTPSIKLKPHGDTVLCTGDVQKVKITKSAGTVVWNDLGTYDSLLLSTNTFKKATISVSSQCFSSDSIRITLLGRPSVNAGPDFTVLPGKPVTFKGTSDGMIEWIPDLFLNDATILTPTARPLVTTKYILRAYNTFGCERMDTMTVFVNSDNTNSVPNLLTPNSDGHNDTWVLSNISDPKNCNVNVFTREGQLVFSSLSYNNNWNGERNNTPLPDGYYVYVIENKKTGKTYTGILTILNNLK